ncbi:Uncharacterised protein [Clostridioides difficile]|uniref:Uncharacterized protein n=1 Tax=Clostridioides difficile TaxID=1496 RepID=A0A381I9J4_CLODI|nr:hypothetical protein CDIF630_01845 [Clostridioides difficile 630]ARE62597.1 hypothetical protein CDIF630erm_01845 [Clostridioides difficile]SJN87895.1 Uncharacterised protein [Clostridioides difficile]SUY24162.1 Uncharacterised protein [Clostridioides difficile]
MIYQFTYHIVNIKHLQELSNDLRTLLFTYHIVNIKPVPLGSTLYVSD